MLWLALYLPELSLESVAGTDIKHSADTPAVLFEYERGRALIHTTNEAARRAGIEKRMTLPAAEVLVRALLSYERKPEEEARTLRQLALWAQQFTSIVSLQPPNGLLLEIEASLHLFEGRTALQKIIHERMRPLGHHYFQAIAPTPAGAWALAQREQNTCLIQSADFRAGIMALPLDVLDLTIEQQTARAHTGLKTIADCWRLPQAELNLRLGSEVVQQIEKLLGLRPDPRAAYTPPEHFESQLCLPYAVTDTEPLAFALNRQLHELSGFLRLRGCGVQHMKLGLVAPDQSAEWLPLNLLRPAHDPAHLLALWREKLERHRLQNPVETLLLKAPKLLKVREDNLDLFRPASGDQHSFTAFLERLRNRLGEGAIQTLYCMDSHLPEQAQCLRAYTPDAATLNTQTKLAQTLWPLTRPLWLLPEPERLIIRSGQPQYHGPLELEPKPERIESGWWRGVNIRRDYFVARNPRHQKLWVFKTLAPKQEWYLHGFF